MLGTKLPDILTLLQMLLCLLACCQGCAVVPLTGCTTIDSADSLSLGPSSNCGCLACASPYVLDFTNNCVFCNSSISYCTACYYSSATPTCTACVWTYFLNSTTNICKRCSTRFYACGNCLPTTPYCLGCDWGFHMLLTNTCKPCTDTLPVSCWRCTDAATCEYCYPNYGFSAPNVCVLCSAHLPNCLMCYNISACQ
jgi:hypothetical protein